MKKAILLFVGWLAGAHAAQAQLQTDAASQQLVLEILEKQYNYEFAEAPPLLARLRARYPQHPVVPLLQALLVYWQNVPLTKHPAAAKQYAAYLNQAVDAGESLLATGKNDPEATFFLLAAHGYLSMKESDAGEFLKAVGEARRAYSYLKKGFGLMESNPEFYFSTGLYNYYREQYPADHGIVKPLMLFFADGDKAKGLQQMEVGFRKGTFTRYEAAYYLAYVLLKHENQPNRALPFSAALYGKFPQNPLFTLRQAEVLVALGRYAEAEPLVSRLPQFGGAVYPVAGAALTGILQEKARKNDSAATAFYQKAIKAPPGERYTQDFIGAAYLGLGRIALRAGNRAQARQYFRQCLKVAEYRGTVEEAKRWLKEP
jgi:tetratricopeptide (TPR) repeat protein